MSLKSYAIFAAKVVAVIIALQLARNYIKPLDNFLSQTIGLA